MTWWSPGTVGGVQAPSAISILRPIPCAFDSSTYNTDHLIAYVVSLQLRHTTPAHNEMLTMLAQIVTTVSQTTNQLGMLGPDDLREVDESLLDYLTEGRVTPAYARSRLDVDGIGDYSRGYVQQRLARLEEHSHVENLFDVGLYELETDPRETTTDESDTT